MVRNLLRACALLLAVPAAASDVPSVADLVAPPQFADPLLSPDGRRVAALDLAGGEPRAVIIDVSGPARRSDSVALAAGTRVDWYRWAGSERLVLGVRDAGGSHLLAVDAATGKAAALGRFGGDSVLHIDRAGRFLLLSAARNADAPPAVWRIDLATGAATEVVKARSGVWEWHADAEGVVRAGTGEPGSGAPMLYRRRDGEAFHRPAGRGAGIEQVAAVAGSDRGYAIAGSPRGRYALFRYDFTAGRLGELVYENPEVDVDSFEVAPDGSLAGVYFTRDREEVAWFDPGVAALQEAVDRALPGINRIVSVSDDRRRLLIASRSPTDPGSFYLHDRKSGTMALLARAVPGLAGKRLSAMRAVRYSARDGLEIPAYLTLPAGREDAAGLPLVVMPHGGPFVRDGWEYDAWVQYLAGRGYAVLQPNFRGSTGYGRDFVVAGDGEWGRGMQDDIDDGVKWLAASGKVDAGRVCIMGASFGGYAAMWAAARNPDLYRCAISFAGISDVAALLEYDRKSFPSARAFADWRGRIQGSDGTGLDQLSPVKSVERMTVPILIAHGAEDATVPMSQSLRLHDALARLGRAHDYVVYRREGHSLDDPANAADFLTRVGAFLDRHNPARP